MENKNNNLNISNNKLNKYKTKNSSYFAKSKNKNDKEELIFCSKSDNLNYSSIKNINNNNSSENSNNKNSNESLKKKLYNILVASKRLSKKIRMSNNSIIKSEIFDNDKNNISIHENMNIRKSYDIIKNNRINVESKNIQNENDKDKNILNPKDIRKTSVSIFQLKKKSSSRNIYNNNNKFYYLNKGIINKKENINEEKINNKNILSNFNNFIEEINNHYNDKLDLIENDHNNLREILLKIVDEIMNDMIQRIQSEKQSNIRNINELNDYKEPFHFNVL